MRKIYTIGYIGRTPASLAEYVQSLNATLIDIRYQPYSKIPHWRKDSLHDQFGTRYVWMRCLGNLRYAEGPPIQIANPGAAVEPIRRFLDRSPVILLCACEHYETCHRTVAAEYLAGRLKVPVVHLPSARKPKAKPS
jgi:uncharacterized protein (DUF488 family)